MEQPIKISQATIADVDELNELVNSAYRGESAKIGWTHEAELLGGIRITTDELKKVLARGDSIILKYLSENKIVACVMLQHMEKVLYLGMLTVSPALQGKGIGKELLDESERRARKLGCSRVRLTVLTARAELINWYTRHGYNDTNERIPFSEHAKFGIPLGPLEFMVMEKEVGGS